MLLLCSRLKFLIPVCFELIQEHDWFCSSLFAELIDLLLGLRSPVDIISLRSRFASFQSLMIHTLKVRFICLKMSFISII